MDFWERLDHLIGQKGLTRKKLTGLADISESALSVWKVRKTYPDADVALKIARILGVTVEFLVEGSTADTTETGATEEARTYSVPNSRFDIQKIVERSLTLTEAQASKVHDLIRIVLD